MKRITQLFSDFSKVKTSTVFLFLLTAAFLVRFPFFFRDYIDRDESTFILLAQSWVDGFLPYTQLWDLKPPLTFAFFASIISIFGKSFVAIRIAGVLLVSLTAFYTYKTACLVTNKKTSFYAAIACITLLSLFGSLQGVMSEHICMAFFMPALYFIASEKKVFWFFFVGVLMGVTVMVKLNMAFPILLIGLLLLFQSLIKKTTTSIVSVIVYGIGILSVIFSTILPYYEIGQTQIWWDSVILAPLKYTEARRYPLIKMAPFFISIIAFMVFAYKKKKLDFKNSIIQLLIIAIIGVLFSFIKGGRINGHYLIQLHPMFLILAAIVLHDLKKTYRLNIPKYAALLLLLVPSESYLEYGNIIKNKLKFGTFFNGEGFSIPAYIIKNDLNTENILFFEYHIAYWNLGTLPPTIAATHPSNICRDELFPFYKNSRKNSLEELEYIMEKLQPKTIVIRKGRRIFDKKEIEENQYVNSYLEKHYRLHATVENGEILQRLE